MNNTATYINSKVLIAELYNDYNIQSADFITRFPTWVVNCLGYLKIHQAYTEVELQDTFVNNCFKLPDYCRSVTDVIINDKKAILKNTLFDKTKITRTNRIIARTPFGNNNSDDEIITPINLENNPSNCEQIEYWVSNNWIHTNVNNGDIVVRYKSVPTIYDSETNMVFPLIYNDEMLKLAIKLYVLKMMLNRGYKHPIQNLLVNNPFANPALYLENIRYKVRTSCNKFTKDRRINIAEINTTLQ